MRSGRAWLSAILWLLIGTTISAQVPGTQDKPARRRPVTRRAGRPQSSSVTQQEPLSRYVPIEASLYFRMTDDDRWRDISGAPRRPELHELLRGQPRVIALPTWRNRKEMITLCKPVDPRAFTKILLSETHELIRETPPVTVYRLETGVWVATNGEVFLLSDIGAGSALFEQSAKMLGGVARRGLFADSRFQEYMQRADPAASGVLFIDEPWSRRRGEDDPHASYRPRWLPNLESGSVEIHLEPNRVRCELRSQRRDIRPTLSGAISPAQLKLIPDSAIAVWMMPVEILSILEFATQYLPRAEPSFYRQLARTLMDSNLTGILPLSLLGPRSTWCMLSGPREEALPLAVILEAKKAGAGAESLAQICKGVVNIINARQAGGGPEASFATEQYKDHAIYELTIIREEGFDQGTLFRELHPSFCAIGGQLVVATDARVLRKIIDASRNEEYALSPLASWARAAESAGDDTRIRGLMNPRRIAAQLKPIQQALQDHDAELLHSPWFQSFKEYFQDTPVQLGARLRRDNPETPGKVYVMHVLEGRPADGKLVVGDYIVGIDGQDLALEDTLEDMRSKLQAKAGGGKRMLRLERDGRLHDVQIVLPRASDKSIVGLLNDTGRAIENLGRLGGVVELITYRQFGTNLSELNGQIVFELKAESGD